MVVRDIKIGRLVGESDNFRIYLGTDAQKTLQPDPTKTLEEIVEANSTVGKEDTSPPNVILKVAKTFEDNDALTAEITPFRMMQYLAEEIADFEQEKPKKSHYDWLFASLKDSFLEPSQEHRRISIFEVQDATLDQLTPLSKLSRDTEIDVRTAIWILGRLLKFYSFLELLEFTTDGSREEILVNYPTFSPDDYLIGPERHRLIFYNFSDYVEDCVAYDFVRSIANFIYSWVSLDTDDDAEKQYLSLFADFAENGRRTAEIAHKELYQLVESLGGVHYHPFTYRKKHTLLWKTIDNI